MPPNPRLIENSYSIRLVMLPSKKIRWRGRRSRDWPTWPAGRPDPSLDLALVVDPEPKLLVLGLELEAGAEAARQWQPLGRWSCPRVDIPVRASRG